jgi:hypothetical protein
VLPFANFLGLAPVERVDGIGAVLERNIPKRRAVLKRWHGK